MERFLAWWASILLRMSSRVRTALTMHAEGFRGSEQLARIQQEARAILGQGLQRRQGLSQAGFRCGRGAALEQRVCVL